MLVSLAALTAAPAAHAASANVAALQVALKAMRLYKGGVDGVNGPGTKRAVRRLQRRRHLHADGIVGPQTRRALGRRGRPRLGTRVMRRGHRGWDVAALQFMLRRRGCRPGGIDGGFGAGTARAVRRCQRRNGLRADGVVGRATLVVLKSATRVRGIVRTSVPSGPVRFLRPINAPMTDGFGMRWGRVHTGVDFPAPTGTPVTAAGIGTVRFAGHNDGGYGNLVVIAHRLGFETWYAHLSAIHTAPGRPVAGRTLIGAVGSTGHSTGPHLHFEVRLNGTPIDPLPRLIG